ncbi:hypothetical protein Mapa_001351 [Marchantia paleacea]|nr:hypothetical protein Mapa_001351 [Marchantia paleacea]
MLTGERRGVSTRRGMTVLGKIPAVPKPINLPSQRLENRGLDPNVEIVPRGSVSWGAAGRSPPTNSSPWGNSTQASSPPVGNGPWGSGPKPGPPPGSSGGPWGANASRPSSAGSGTRPSSAGSIGQTQEALAAANAWGPATARPSSASGVLGQAQSQAPVPRPRSAETRTSSAQAPVLTRFADHPNGPPSPAAPAWGGAGTARKLSEDSHSLHQPARFTLTRVDFPTLGSEKNPDLRPQQNKTGGPPAERPGSADGKGPPDERPPPGPGGPYDEMPPTGPGGYGGQDRMQEGWRREAGPYGGHPGMGDGNWHREGPPPSMQQHGGGQHQPDTWRREPGHGAAPGGGPSDDNWRRGGPPVGPYGPPGPGRFQHDPSGFIHQQRYGPGPGPGPYGRGGGPGGFGRHGEMYGNAGPFARPGGAPPPRPVPPMGPGMYQGPGPYENYYGPPGVPGPGYGNMDEREMMMLGMVGGPPGMYNGFPQGPHEPFGRYPHGGPGPGPRHMQQNNSGMMRDRNEGMGYEGEGYRDNLKYKESSNFKEGGGFKDGGFGKEGGFPKERPERPASAGEVRRVGHTMSSGSGSSLAGTDMPRPLSARSSHHGGHRDWGAAASSDEPMDFSKPVFEEDVSSASPGLSKQSSSVSRAEIDISPTTDEIKSSEQAKRRDPSQDSGASEEKAKGWVSSGEVKDGPVVALPTAGTVSKSDSVQTWRQVDVESEGNAAKSRTVENSSLETKDQVRKALHPTEESEQADKRPMKDGSSPGPPSRERSMGREHVFSPHGGRGGVSKRENSFSHSSGNAGSAPRPGQHGFVVGGSNYRPSLTNVSRAPNPLLNPEVVVVEEVVTTPVTEKHVSSPSSPSGSDSQRNSEKLRILKRVGDGPESPHKDIVNTAEIGHTEVPAAVPTELKEDSKPKSKSVNNHDGEKEWRPKVPVMDAASVEVNRSSLSATLKPSTLSSVIPPVVSAPITAADGPDKAGPDSEISGDSYDYEAQRARMKEIAAQRARQLRKEEEERIKEQKAKAMAKLEELNRRSSGAPVSQPVGHPVVEDGGQESPNVSVPQDEIETVSAEDIVQEGTVIDSGAPGVGTPRGGVRSGRNEHGKRERVIDRKSNGRSRDDHRVKIGFEEHREMPKTRLSVSLSQTRMEPPLLPSPSQQASPSQAVVPPLPALVSNVQQLETHTAGPPEVSVPQVAPTQQQVPTKGQDARYRGKQFVSQPKQVGRQTQSVGEVEAVVIQESVTAADSTSNASGWTGGSPLDLDPKEVTLSLGSGHPSSEAGAAAFRKKKSKSSGRNKPKLELTTAVTDLCGEVNQGWNMGSSALNEPVNEVGRTTPQATGSIGGDEDPKIVPLTITVKDPVSQELKSDVATAEQPKDTGIESGGSDVGSLRSNGDVPNKRSQRKSQPARRVVRDRGTSQDVRVADKPHGGEGMVWAPVRSPSGSHPNGPKGGFGGDGIVEPPVERKDEPPVVQQTARARRAELERYTPKPVVKQHAQQQEEMQQLQAVPVPTPDTSVVTVVDDAPQSSESLTEIKFGSEARQAEGMGKHGRAHASWRQRGAASERGNAPKETPQVVHVEPVDTGAKQPSLSHQTSQTHQRSRGVPNTSSEQSRPINSQHSRPAAVQVSRQQTPPTEKEQPNPQVNQQGRTAHVNAPQPPPVSYNREHKATQESVTPYQPPRSIPNQANRGIENEGHGSHEHVRSQRGNPLQMDRHTGAPGKFERDYHTPHTPQERPAPHNLARHNSRHHGAPNSHDRDHLQGHSGGPRSTQGNTGEGAPLARDKDQVSVPVHGAGQGRTASQAVHGHHVAPVLPERERSPPKVGNVQLARSPPRQRGRQQVVPHERDQTAPSHPHHQQRFRQQGHEREHHREVTNAVHHQQQQRVPTDGHWQQTGVVADRVPPSEFGQPYQHPSRASHKSQSVTPSTEHDQGPLAHPVANQFSRSEASNKPQGPSFGDSHKHSHYQSVPSLPPAQHQKPLQQGVAQGPKAENVHNSSHWNGERGGSPPFRGRDHGHTRRGRFGSRGSGAGGRHAEIESRRDQASKQRPTMDAAGNAVPSQVGG